jgi:hypothetical protein
MTRDSFGILRVQAATSAVLPPVTVGFLVLGQVTIGWPAGPARNLTSVLGHAHRLAGATERPFGRARTATAVGRDWRQNGGYSPVDLPRVRLMSARSVMRSRDRQTKQRRHRVIYRAHPRRDGGSGQCRHGAPGDGQDGACGSRRVLRRWGRPSAKGHSHARRDTRPRLPCAVRRRQLRQQALADSVPAYPGRQ